MKLKPCTIELVEDPVDVFTNALQFKNRLLLQPVSAINASTNDDPVNNNTSQSINSLLVLFEPLIKINPSESPFESLFFNEQCLKVQIELVELSSMQWINAFAILSSTSTLR